MESNLKALLEDWNSVGIVSGFLRILGRTIDAVAGLDNDPETYDDVLGLGDDYYEDWLMLGQPVEVRGRLSGFAPIYFPIAYSPQANVSFRMKGGGTYASMVPNPAPARTRLQFVDEAVLAFLFPLSCQGAPRITSPLHLNRMATVKPGGDPPTTPPWSKAEASVPVLLGREQLRYLERKVEVRARIAPLPNEVEEEISASNEELIKLYYHGFYRDDAFPEPGFALDARPYSLHGIRDIGEPAPFRSSISIEFGFETSLAEEDFEAALEEVLKKIDPHPQMDGTGHHYQPAYHEPGGYKIVQKSRSPLLAHLAFSQRALHFSMPVDTTGDLAAVDSWFRPSVAELCDRLGAQDDGLSLETLFTSDKRIEPL